MQVMRVVAADVGNSSIKLMTGILNAEGVGRQRSVRSLSIADLAESERSIGDSQLPNWFDQSSAWFVSSVNDANRERLRRVVEQAGWVETWHDVRRSEIPLTIDLQEPEKVGIDRVLAALAAHRLYGAGHNTIVVDCGTALTIDLVDRSGTFRGGVIMAGPATNLLALNSMTDALPDLSEEKLSRPESVLGRSTRQAMLSGAWYSGLGAIKEVVSAMQQLSTDDPGTKVVGTGGGLGPWKDVLPDDWILVDDLVLDGIIQVATELNGHRPGGFRKS